MTRIALISFLAAISALPACAEHSSSPPVHPPSLPAPQLPPEASSLVTRFVESGFADGVAVALISGDRVTLGGFGRSSDAGAPIDPAHTLFEVGSVTKVFTGLLLATMVTSHEVTLDEPVSSLLPPGVTVPSKDGKPITLVSLATHSSGLPEMPPNFAPQNGADPYADYDTAKLYAALGAISLEHAPGDEFDYSNLGAALLGHALALRAKRPYGDLVRERLLAPLGLHHTFVGAQPASEVLAQGHGEDGEREGPWNLDVFAPAGAIRSSAADMARFVVANLHPPEALREPLKLAREPHGDRGGGRMGLGWHLDTADMPEVAWHSGETGGFHAFVAVDEGKQAGVVVLANTATGTVDRLGIALLHVARGEPSGWEPPRVVKLSPEVLERCVGRYELAKDVVITVTSRGGFLYAEENGHDMTRLYALSETSFSYGFVQTLDFEMGADGRAARLVVRGIENGNAMMRGDRIK